MLKEGDGGGESGRQTPPSERIKWFWLIALIVSVLFLLAFLWPDFTKYLFPSMI